jgi:hypothetical protein
MPTDHNLHLTLLPSTNDRALFGRKRQQAITRFHVEARSDGAGLTLLVSSWTLRVLRVASVANLSSASATLHGLR